MGNEARLTDMVFILDKSGSMSGLEKDTIGGFNSMIRKQRTLAGDALVTTVLFDTSIKRLYDGVSIGKVTDMTEEDYEAGGSTALLDAIGSTISAISRRQKRMEGRPDHTIFVIITDKVVQHVGEFFLNIVEEFCISFFHSCKIRFFITGHQNVIGEEDVGMFHDQ